MAKVIKNITVTWNWLGDFYALKRFNVAVTPSDSDPKNGIVIQATSGNDTSSYKFSNVTLDDSVTYTAWVQAIYDGADSDWLSASNITVTDDGNATLSTKVYTDNSINNIQVGGANILRGTNIVTSLTSTGLWSNGTWRSASGGNATRVSIDVTDSPNPNIKKGWQLTHSSVSPHASSDISQDNIPVTNGQTYTMSCYARCQSGSVTLRLQYGKSPYPTKTFTVDSNAWKKFSYTFTVGGVSDGSTNGTTNVYIGLTSDSIGTLQFCGMQLESGNKNTDWTPSPEDIEFQIYNKTGLAVRYIRDWSNGSTSNAGNHWVEIQAIKSGVNVAKGKNVTTNNTTTTNIGYITDGVITSNTYFNGGDSLKYVQVDLGSIYQDLDYIKVWHFYEDGRTYHNTKTEVSSDGVNWFPIFDSYIDGEYAETSNGKTYDVSYANALAYLKATQAKVTATAYADGVITAEEQARINDVNAKLASAKTYADDKVDSIQVGGRNLIRESYLVANNTKSASYDKGIHTWTLTVANGAGGTWGAGLRVEGKNVIIPIGSYYTVSFEIWSSVDTTWNNDVNNYFLNTTTSTNDNDDTSFRRSSSRKIGANTWTKCWFLFKNRDSATDVLYDNSNFGILNNSGADITYKIRNIKGELGNKVTDWSPSPLDIDQNISDAESNAKSYAEKLSTKGLGMKVNYSTFTGVNAGELYMHGYDSNGNPADVDGYLIVNGNKMTVPKGMVNPDVKISKGYLLYSSSVNKWWIGTYDSNGNWTYYKEGETSTGVPKSNCYFVGYVEMDSAENFTFATLWNDYKDHVEIIKLAQADLAKSTIDSSKSTWDRANNINSDGTFNTGKLAGTINDSQIANSSKWNTSLMNKGSAENVNWNTIVATGIYVVAYGSTPPANFPTGAYPYGMLTVTAIGNVVTQTYVTHSGANTYIRSKFNATDWQVWDATSKQVKDSKGTWDKASYINNDGTFNTNRLTGTIVDSQIASATSWNGAKTLLDSWKSGTTLINGGKIATNTIFAQQIAIGDFTNLSQINEEKNPNGNTVVTVNNQKYFKVSNSAYGKLEILFNTYVEFKVNDEYYIAWNGYRDSGLTTLQAILRYAYTDGTWNNAGSVSMLPTTSDTRMSANLKVTAAPTVGKTLNYVYLFLEKDGTSGSGYYYVRNIEVRKRYAGELIVDGSITTDKITANGIMADKIKGGTLTLGGSNNVNGTLKINNASGTTVIQADKDGGGKYNIRSMDSNGNVRAVLGEYTSGRYGLAIYNQYGELVTGSDRPPTQNDSGIGVAGCYLSLSNVTSGIVASANITGCSTTNNTITIDVEPSTIGLNVGDRVYYTYKSSDGKGKIYVSTHSVIQSINGKVLTFISVIYSCTGGTMCKIERPTGTLNVSEGYIINQQGQYIKRNAQSVPITLGMTTWNDMDGFVWYIVWLDSNGGLHVQDVGTSASYSDIKFVGGEPLLQIDALPNMSYANGGIMLGAILSGLPEENNVFHPQIQHVHQIFHEPVIRKQIPFYVDSENNLCASNTNYVQWNTTGKLFAKYEYYTITIPIGGGKKSAMFHISSYNGTGNVSSGFFGVTGRRNHDIDERQHFFGVSPSYSYSGSYKTVYGTANPTLTDVYAIDGSYLSIADAYISDNSSGQVLKIVVYNKYSSSITKDIYINAHVF